MGGGGWGVDEEAGAGRDITICSAKDITHGKKMSVRLSLFDYIWNLVVNSE